MHNVAAFILCMLAPCATRAHAMGAMGADSPTTRGNMLYTGLSVCLNATDTPAGCVNATNLVGTVCDEPQGSFASACTLFKQCNTSFQEGMAGTTVDTNANSVVCDPFGLLATLCHLDVAGGGILATSTGACSELGSMCAVGQASAALCSAAPSLAWLPNTTVVNAMVQSICSVAAGMDTMGTTSGMSSIDSTGVCTSCTLLDGETFPSDCDLLRTYSTLCLGNPGIFQCSDWNSMCLASPTLFLCSATMMGLAMADSMLMTPMYLNTGLNFYLLFQSWVPSTQGMLAGAFFAVFFLGLLHEAMSAWSGRLERTWAQAMSCKVEEGHGSGSTSRFPWGEMCLFLPWTYEEITRMILRFATVCISYLLMLCVMSFSVTIFFAAATGLAVGSLLFHRFMVAPTAGRHQHTTWQPPLGNDTIDGFLSNRVAVWGLRAMEITVGVLVLVFTLKDHLGVPGLGPTSDIREWNLHVILMVFAFPVAMSEAFLTYRYPLLSLCTCEGQCQCNSTACVAAGVCGCKASCNCTGLKLRQALHVVLQTAAVVMAFIGLAAVVYYKTIPDPDDLKVEWKEVYTVHSWVGTLALFFMALQYLVGVGGLALLTLRPGYLHPSTCQHLSTCHGFVSKAAFMGGVVSCAVGFIDMQTISVGNWADAQADALADSLDTALDTVAVDPAALDAAAVGFADPGYAPYSRATLETSILGALMFGITVAHLFLDNVQTSRRIKASAATAARGASGGAVTVVMTHSFEPSAPGEVAETQPPTETATPTHRPVSAGRYMARMALGANWNVLIIRTFEVVACILVFLFAIRDNDALPNYSSHHEWTGWNFHVILSVIAFPILMSEAILAYRAPLFGSCGCKGRCGAASGCPCGVMGQCRCSGLRVRKTLHVVLQTGILIMAFVGLAAVVYYKKAPAQDGADLPLTGSAQMYSTHAFIGAITLFMLAGQWVVGVGAFLILRNRMTPDLRRGMAGWHAFFGKATFSGGLISCIVGLMDIQMIQVDGGAFDARSSASEELAFLSAIIFGLVLGHYYLDHFTAPKQAVQEIFAERDEVLYKKEAAFCSACLDSDGIAAVQKPCCTPI